MKLNNKSIIVKALLVALVLGIISSIVFQDYTCFTGFLVGGIFSIIIYITIIYFSEFVLSKKAHLAFSMVRSLITTMLYLLLFYFSWTVTYLNFFTTVMGLACIQLVVIFDYKNLV